ncbi:hypothetical protein [uncultured Aquincola sp.]|uniref:hypothetical protein n=1 Tax=uncultured Aquincola sp. TaxID=886556 RepID=UPI0032B22359
MIKTAAANPFALMINPDVVLRAVERSERLARLSSRICRPLDKPLIPKNDDIDYGDDDAEDGEV